MRSLFGKLLSINVATKGLRIEALGLRNAWRFSFDRANGDLYIGDVGQGAIEEINWTPANSPGLENYGWDVYEGRSKFEDKALGPGKLVSPVAQYSHDDGCSVTGGYVYRGSNASLRGRYIYGDYCSGIVWSFKLAGGKAHGPAARGLQDREPDLVRRGHRRRALRRLARRHDLPPDALTHWICRTCATQFADSSEPPRALPDLRRRAAVRRAGRPAVDDARGARSRVTAASCARTPATSASASSRPFAIGQRMLLAETAEGNVLWDMIPLVDDAAVEAVQARGRGARDRDLAPALLLRDGRVERGARVASRSCSTRPTASGSCGPIRRSSSGRATTKELFGGLTLLRLGGHYPGGTVLHDRERRTLLSGDIVQVIPDRRFVGFMWSYPNLIPLPGAEVLRIAAALEPCRSTGSSAPGGTGSCRATATRSSAARPSATRRAGQVTAVTGARTRGLWPSAA